jgi:pyruvate kinase
MQTSSLTEKDLVDLAAGVAAGVDYVALSFVRSAADIQELRVAMRAVGGEQIPICAKIEKPQALENIDAILDCVDVIMVARGDLGVEIPLERVPIVQKELIHAANRAGVLVITATQMLDSMERNPRPTRAETTDVANAILDGTDAIMLSGETAIGRYPVRAVEVMNTIARQAEQSTFFVRPPLEHTPNFEGHGGALSRAASFLVREAPFPVVVFTWSGSSAIVISKSRPLGPIFALTPHSTVYDALSLVWGVTPIMIPTLSTTDELVSTGERVLRDQGLVVPGQEIVVLAGQTSTRGVTNLLKVEVVQDR